MVREGMRLDLAAVVLLLWMSFLACTPPMPISYRGHSLSPDANGPKALPTVKRKAIDGREVDTSALRGKVVVVKFFAKFCEPCKKTLPFVEAYARAHPEVAVVGVSEDESEADVKELVVRYELSFPVVQDGGHSVSGRFRVGELPMVFVADPQGKIRWIGGPLHTEEAFANAVQAAANGP